MAVNSHAPRPDVGHALSLAMGRPAYDAAPPSRECRGQVWGRRCQRNALWLLPEVDYCGTHIPSEYIPIVTARRDLWIALSGDVWREVLADCPLDREMTELPPAPPRQAKVNMHTIHVKDEHWPPRYIECYCGAIFRHEIDARPNWQRHTKDRLRDD